MISEAKRNEDGTLKKIDQNLESDTNGTVQPQ